MTANILIVDDEPDIRALISGILEDEGYNTREAESSDKARLEIEKARPDVVILDIWLKDSAQDGLALLEELHPKHPTLPIIMISGHGTIEMAVNAIRNGAYDFIEKPFKSDRLLVMIARALETARLKEENRALRANNAAGSKLAQELTGKSPHIQSLKSAIAKVAPSSSRVLITGEPGCGKEVLARMIHAQSPRASSPFLIVNCSSISPERIDIELFGAEAHANQGTPETGLIERANGGTILFGEVADLPLPTQSKLLRFLQDQSFQPVGSTETRTSDVRVIAASNKDLQQLIQDGSFRSDLYYRLNVVPLELPSLRERGEDILDLFTHFYNEQTGKKKSLDELLKPETQTLLLAQTWPGNVRQLRNLVEWLLIMHAGEDKLPFAAENMPNHFLKPNGNGNGNGATEGDDTGLAASMLLLSMREAREQFENAYLQSQLRRFGGNISKTARFIGMERSALHRKLKSLGALISEDTGEDEPANSNLAQKVKA